MFILVLIAIIITNVFETIYLIFIFAFEIFQFIKKIKRFERIFSLITKNWRYSQMMQCLKIYYWKFFDLYWRIYEIWIKRNDYTRIVFRFCVEIFFYYDIANKIIVKKIYNIIKKIYESKNFNVFYRIYNKFEIFKIENY